MKKYLLIAFIFILLITTMSQAASARSFINLAENNFYFQGINALSLDRSNLFLPNDSRIVNEENKNFSKEGQEKLINLASQFDRVTNSEGLSFSAELNYDDIDLDKVITYNGEELETVKLNNYENFYIETNYEDNLEEVKSFLKTTFNYNYQLNSKTTLSASYDLTNKTFENEVSSRVNNSEDENNTDDENNEKENNEEDDNTKEDNNGEEDEDKIEDESEKADEELNPDKEDSVQPLYDNLIDQQGRVGISYQGTDNIIVSADYVKNNIFREIEGDSTVFGLEYIDEEGKLKARYEIIDGKEHKETITGVELGLKDLATFSASYKLLDPNFIKDNGESVWDFGVDINLSESTQFSIDYQLSDKIANDSSNLLLKDKASNINANFKINF